MCAPIINYTLKSTWGENYTSFVAILCLLHKVTKRRTMLFCNELSHYGKYRYPVQLSQWEAVSYYSQNWHLLFSGNTKEDKANSMILVFALPILYYKVHLKCMLDLQPTKLHPNVYIYQTVRMFSCYWYLDKLIVTVLPQVRDFSHIIVYHLTTVDIHNSTSISY